MDFDPWQASETDRWPVGRGAADTRIIRSVDCATRTRYLLIPLLTCPNGTHWCAVGGSVEHPCAAKKRAGHLDANYWRGPARGQTMQSGMDAVGCPGWP